MKDYEKMINTVKALNEVFGDKEFTRKDYECKILRNACVLDDMELNCGDILGVATVLDLNHSYIVRKVREEDFITKNSEGKKVVGTRYYYEVNSDFMKIEICLAIYKIKYICNKSAVFKSTQAILSFWNL